jgi:hypothetical protein
MKQHTEIRNSTPKYKTAHRNMKQHTEINTGTSTNEELKGHFGKLRKEELNL